MKNRLVIIATLISLVPSLCIAIYFFVFTGHLIETNTRSEIEKEVDLTSKAVSDYVRERDHNTQQWSELSVPKKALSTHRSEELNSYLDTLSKKNPEYDNILVLDKNLQFFAINTPLSKYELEDRSPSSISRLLPAYQNSAKQLESRSEASQVKFLQNAEGPELFLSSKIDDEKGNRLGYFVAHIPAAQLEKQVRGMKSRLERYGFHTLSVYFDNPENPSPQNPDLFSYCHYRSKLSLNKSLPNLCLSLAKSELQFNLWRSGAVLFGCLLLLLIAFSLIFSKVIRIVMEPLIQFLAKLQKISKGKFEPLKIESKYPEIRSLEEGANEIIAQMKDYHSALKQRTEAAAIGNMASQVAHDIRSPLAALNMLLSDVASLTEEKRILLRSAIRSIQDIANGLLARNKEVLHSEKSETSVELLSPLIENVVSEKRLQFRDRLGIEIDYRYEINSCVSLAKIEPLEFRRLLSNLINNSVEAFSQTRGRIDVHLESTADEVLIYVRDNGKGIPKDVLPRLMVKGATFDKPDGSGLGLAHAKEHIELWGGKISIESELGKGTQVTFRMPRAKPPSWFVDKIEISASTQIVALDDDASIHRIWDGRFSTLYPRTKLVHFSRPEDADEFLLKEKDSPQFKDFLFLVDYEFIGSRTNGLSWILERNLASQSILVTSRFEEILVRKVCEEKGLRLLPKGLSSYIPIFMKTEELSNIDAVLIDDDPLVHMTWQFYAKKNSKLLETYSTPEAFLANAEKFPKATAIFVDRHLGEGLRGEEVAKTISHLQFTNIFIATGDHVPERDKPAFVSGVVGKDPQF